MRPEYASHVVAWLAAAVALLAARANAQITPERLYYQVNRPVPMQVETPTALEGEDVRPEIILYARTGAATPDDESQDGLSSRIVAREAVTEGRVDLAAIFPILWTAREPELLFAQLTVNGESVGPPVVIQPLMTPDVATSLLSHRLETAVRSKDRAGLLQLLSMSPFQLDRLSQTVHTEEPARRVHAGLRTYVDQHIRFETSFGAFQARLRPDVAPYTSYHFRHLVESGFFTQIDIHRVVNDDGRGRPFIIQAGDPTSEGFGGPGFRIDFEQSSLPHTFGVLSLARQMNDPNSGGSQFFICLSREACAPLDGQFASFAEVIEGGEVIEAMAAVAVDLADPSDPDSPFDRPIEPPVISKATLVDAPPFGTGAPAAQPTATGVRR